MTCVLRYVNKNVKSSPSQQDTSLHCQSTDTGLMNRVVCLLTLQLSLVLNEHGGCAHSELVYSSADSHPSRY